MRLGYEVTVSRIHICATCKRDEALAQDEPSRGQLLLDAVRKVLRQEALEERITLRQVHCLNGCPRPCNVSFRGEHKHTLRFSRLSSQDADAIAAFAVLYADSETGDIDETQWPAPLLGKLSANTPPRARIVSS